MTDTESARTPKSLPDGGYGKTAEDLAKKVPNVQQVVNEIEINNSKHSTTAS